MPPNTKKIILLHGWHQGDISDIPEFLPDNPANWMGWSKLELDKLGYEVTTPFLRDGHNQEYADWKNQLEALDIDENTTLVGWSAGGAFWVRWLGETKRQIDKLILVAPAKLYTKGEEESNFDRFMDFEIDKTIQDHTNGITIFISNDWDDLLRSADLYSDTLGVELTHIPNQGHFTNSQRSSVEFPELIDVISTMKAIDPK